MKLEITITALAFVGVGVFIAGFVIGVLATNASAAVQFFDEHRKAEAARVASIEEVRAAWRDKAARERLAFEHKARKVPPIRVPGGRVM